MNLTLGQAVFLGVLQGFAELFPISSLAKTILLPALLGWDLGNPENSRFLAFVVALHLATAAALTIYFWNDWKHVLAAYIGSIQRRQFIYDSHSKLAWLLVVGSLVVGLFGFVFEKKLRRLFEDPKYAWVVAAVLILNGLLMLLADVIKKRSAQPAPAAEPVPSDAVSNDDPATDAPTQRRGAEDSTLIEGAAIGATQTLALIPGISRSGVTIVSGLLAGMSYEEAGRFSFMLGTVVIGLAGVLKVPSLLVPEARAVLWLTIPAALAAGLTAYLSTRFLMRYFRHHRLGPFAWFCIIFGLYSLVMLRH